jgi:ABC transporter
VRRADSTEAVRAALELGLPQERLGDADLLTFSGGMQQKLLFARTLSTRPRILLLDEPTRGVDLETRSTIYRVLRQRAADGAAILVVSSDFEELLGFCNRVVVISDGRSVAELPAEFFDVEKLLMFAAPKSSSSLIGNLLASMVERYGGSAFWVYSDVRRVFCFDCRTAPGVAELLQRGAVHLIDETALPTLPHDGGLCERRDARGDVVAVPFKGKRGHYLGHLGLAMQSRRDRPPTAEIVEFICATTRHLS